MSRLIALAVLLVLAVSAATQTLPGQLTGADGQRIAQLERASGAQEAKGDLKEAIRLADEVIALRTKLQGQDHWQTRTARRHTETLRKVAAFSDAERTAFEAARKQLVQGNQHAVAGRFPAAQRAYEAALAGYGKLLGADNLHTSIIANNLGRCLHAQGNAAEAEVYFRKAIAGARAALGDDHPDTLNLLNSLATILQTRGHYAAAEVLLRQALAGNRKLLGEDHVRTAACYNNLATDLMHQGDYAGAEPLLVAALAASRKSYGEDHPTTGRLYGNLALCRQGQGDYAAAEALLREALERTRKRAGEQDSATALCLNNLANNLMHEKRYAEAEKLLRQALATYRAAGENHEAAVACLQNIGLCLSYLDQPARGRERFEEAYQLARKHLGAAHPATLRALASLAHCQGLLGRFAAAETQLHTVLDERRRTLGAVHAETVQAQAELGLWLTAQNKHEEAAKTWLAAAEGFEAVRLRVSEAGPGRVAVSTELAPHAHLALCEARLGAAEAAWQHAEAGFARGLLDELAPTERDHRGERAVRLEQLDQQLARLAGRADLDDAARQRLEKLQEQRTALQADLLREAAVLVRKAVYELRQVQPRLPADAALVFWLDRQPLAHAANDTDHWACVLRREGLPRWVKLAGSGEGGAWTTGDLDLPQRLAAVLSAPPGTTPTTAAALAKQLYRQRLAPLESALAGVRRLIVIPAGWLAGVPLETLTERYAVSYTPSATVFARLQEQRAAHPPVALGARPALAVGDPAFPAETPPTAHQPVSFTRLPATRREVELVRTLLPGTVALLGDEASKQRLQALAAAGRLREFGVLHLATHGILDRRTASQCALALAPDTGSPTPSRLTVADIRARWKLDADLVTLSACETGLGRNQGGEGYVGFTQAMFAAGARSMVVSLWRVDDDASALLMKRFYQNLLGKRPGLTAPLGKAAALHEAKAWLRQLSREEVEQETSLLPRLRGPERTRRPPTQSARPFAHPYFWSAFILLGEPE